MSTNNLSANLKNTLDNLDERSLFKLYQKEKPNIELRNYIFERYFHLVKMTATNKIQSYRHTYDIGDLISIVSFGLISAIENYNYKYNVKFRTYAYKRLIGEIGDHLREDTFGGRMVLDYKKMKQKLYQKNEVMPSKIEILKALGKKGYNGKFLKYDFDIEFLYIEHFLVTNDDYDDLPDIFFKDVLIDHDEYIENKLENKELSSLIENYIYHISNDQYKKIMVLYYYEGLTMKDIADIYHVTESRISQIHNECIRDMKQKLHLKDFLYN